MISEESFVDFKCPYCEEPVSFPSDDVGFARACPSCNEAVIVPEPGAEVGKRIPLPLQTERLLLRRFAPGDWKDLLEFMSGEEVFRYTGGAPMDDDAVLRWLDLESGVKLTTPDQTFYLAIQLVEPEKLVGFVGLRTTEPLQANVHLILNPQYQGQGLGTEALKATLDFCFKEIHLHRLSARCDGRNVAGLRLFDKAGFRREGEFIKDTRGHEGWVNSVWFGILQEEHGCA